MSTRSNKLSLSTWNIKGLGNPIKRRKILNFLKSKKYDIVYLQETHLTSLESRELRRDWVGHVFYSAGSSRSRGVATLISRFIQFKCLKEVSDDEGRMVIIQANVQGQDLMLANIYAPNGDSPAFFIDLESKLHDAGDFPVILAGDFNIALDSVLDRSGLAPSRPPRSVQVVKDICSTLGLIDIWRLLNPTGRDYTFFSSAHKVYSRIDLFLISKSLLPTTLSCSIGNIIISDHATVSLDILPCCDNPRQPRWRLNNSLLQDSDFKEKLRAEIKFYMESNVPTAPSAGVAWDAMKAYLRGFIIQHAAHKKKQYNAELIKLEREINDMERKLKQNMSAGELRELTQLKYRYNSLLTKRVEFMLQRARQKYFESGDKAGRLLARYIKQKQTNSAIAAVHTHDGELATKPRDINETFKKFYEDLYTSDCTAADEDINSFLVSLHLPKLDATQQEALDSSITREEILEAIAAMPTGKTPGPDGFTAEFFKCYAEELLPLLEQTLSEILEKGELTSSLEQAIITLILKPDKEPTECKSYRPISLMQTDCKILSKILANRLDKVITSLVHHDQVGFIRKRYSTDNIRRMINVMWAVQNSNSPVAAISLDAEKAFDRVEWRYLFGVLRAFGFGQVFIRWIEILYKHPIAAVQTNGVISPYFMLGRGTRQGSGLSPALFCLALEPLAEAIRKNSNFPGVTIGDSQHKIMLYADDLLCFASEPTTSIPALLNTINQFSKLSGYKINWDKSEALPLTAYCPKTLFQAGSFQWPPGGIRYLGILFPPILNKIVEKNFDPLLRKISCDIDRWSSLFLSLWGKVNVIKMTCVPKLNYLIQSLPIHIPMKYFKDFDRICNKFFWNGKRPRMRLEKLQLPVDKGGLGLPKLLFYHYAFSLRHIAQWSLPPERAPPWSYIECNVCLPFTPLGCLSIKMPPDMGSHPVLSHLLNIWKKVVKIYNIDPYLNSESSIWRNPKLCVGKAPFLWKGWVDAGIRTLGDLFQNGVLKSFEELFMEFGLPRSFFWQYLQLRHLISAVLGSPTTPPQHSELLSNIIKIFGSGHEASRYYSLIFNQVTGTTTALRTIWERDLNISFSEREWGRIIQNQRKLSRDIRIRLIQFKITNRFYWTPSRLHRLGLKDSSNCWKCQSSEGTLLHALWHCTQVQGFWDQVHTCIKEITSSDFEFSPRLYVLGDPLIVGGCGDAEMIQTAIMVGRQILMRGWKKTEAPSYQEWFIELGKVASYEQLFYRQNDRWEDYIRKWGKYLMYMAKDT